MCNLKAAFINCLHLLFLLDQRGRIFLGTAKSNPSTCVCIVALIIITMINNNNDNSPFVEAMLMARALNSQGQPLHVYERVSA